MRRCRGWSVHLARKRGREAHMRRGQGERNDPGGRSRTPRTPPEEAPLPRRAPLACCAGVLDAPMSRFVGAPSTEEGTGSAHETRTRRNERKPGERSLARGQHHHHRARRALRGSLALAPQPHAASATARALGRGAEIGRAPALLICKRKGRGGALRCTASKDGERFLVDRVHGTTRAQRSQNKKKTDCSRTYLPQARPTLAVVGVRATRRRTAFPGRSRFDRG